MRFLLAFLLLSAWPGRCQIRDVVKSAEIDQIFARTMQSLEVLAKTNYASNSASAPKARCMSKGVQSSASVRSSCSARLADAEPSGFAGATQGHDANRRTWPWGRT